MALRRISPLILVSRPINIGFLFAKIKPKAYPTLYARDSVTSTLNLPLIPSVPKIDCIIKSEN